MQKIMIGDQEALLEKTQYQITDIEFAKRDIETTRILAKMKEIKDQVYYEKQKLKMSHEKKHKKIQGQIEKKQEKYNKVKEQYQKVSEKIKKDPKPNSRPYVYAFITFRSMDGFELVEQSY